MFYGNNKTNLNISREEDKKLIMNIISTFLETHDVIDVATKNKVTERLVTIILNNRKLILRLYDQEIWKRIVKIKEENEKILQEQEYEQLMNNILIFMITSLYNYDEICEKLYIIRDTLTDMINNEEYIKNHFGIHMLEKLKKAREIRRNLANDNILSSSTNEIVKDPKYRQIVKPNVIKVSKYEHQLIKKVAVFLEYDGDSKNAAINSSYPLNEIITSLADPKLKGLLLEDVYEEVQELLEIESILTQNRMVECKALIGNVVLSVHREKGNINRIKRNIGYSEAVIRRILEHPYVSIICNSLDINVSVDMLHYEEKKVTDYDYPFYHFDSVGRLVEIDMKEVQLVLDIADFIIESNATYAQAAQKFGFSKKTICVKMKNKLPYISKTKSKEVNKIVNRNTAKSVENDEELQERVLLESELLLRGYTIKQVAYLVNNKYSSTQRDLSKRLPQLSEEKGQLVKTMLKYNQAYKNQ